MIAISCNWIRRGIGIHAFLLSLVAFALGHGEAATARAELGCSVPPTRSLVTTEPEHAGNVFLDDEDVVVPAAGGLTWRATDERGRLIAAGLLGRSSGSLAASLGRPGIGWYRVEFAASDGVCVGWTTAAVLARPRAPVPEDSPICVDAALSWLAGDTAERQHLARLAALAGVNWIRDRVHWRELESGPGEFCPETKYDVAAALQAQAGLNVLQVFHTLPKWVAESAPGKDARCPDLRQVHAFCKAMSIRFGGRVQAWEPWNEGNAANFGGLTISELCTLQKAAFLGFKAGDPGVTVGWNPLGGINTPSLVQGILANETWPYYDTYNIHSYDWPHGYETLWQSARDAASGHPIWVTECDRGIEAEKDSPTGDLSPEYDLRKAELIAQEYASSLGAGATRHYHFVLSDYREGRIQFGLLRRDLTPRPSYVALAAVGRFLAGATCLGRWMEAGAPDEARVFAFRGRPDGVAQDVLVAWTEKPVDWPERGAARAPWRLPEGLRVTSTFDYLGRPLPDGPPKELVSSPVFLLLPAGEAAKLALSTPKVAELRTGTPTPIVLQLRWPEARVAMHRNGWTDEHDYQVPPGSETRLQISVYNLGSSAAAGTVGVDEMPPGWSATTSQPRLAVGPMGRQSVTLRIHAGTALSADPRQQWIRVSGRFGSAGRAVLAFRVRLEVTAP